MIDWMPNILKRTLTRLLESSPASSPKVVDEVPFIVNGRPIYGSDLYRQIVEEDQKKCLAEDAEAARRQLSNLG